MSEEEWEWRRNTKEDEVKKNGMEKEDEWSTRSKRIAIPPEGR
jgi:hypothetical protein